MLISGVCVLEEEHSTLILLKEVVFITQYTEINKAKWIEHTNKTEYHTLSAQENHINFKQLVEIPIMLPVSKLLKGFKGERPALQYISLSPFLTHEFGGFFKGKIYGNHSPCFANTL